MDWRIHWVLCLIFSCVSETNSCPICDTHPENCRKLQGIYTVRHLKLGYNPILSIPQGACHINVSELNPSSNYLALSLSTGVSIINGGWDLNVPGIYPGAGTNFLYSRRSNTCKTECIQSTGPLIHNVTIEVIYYSPNEGILYEFLLPKSMSIPSLSVSQNINTRHLQSNVQTPLSKAGGTNTYSNRRKEYQIVPTKTTKPINDIHSVDIITNPTELQRNRDYFNRKIVHRKKPLFIPISEVQTIKQRQELKAHNVGLRDISSDLYNSTYDPSFQYPSDSKDDKVNAIDNDKIFKVPRTNSTPVQVNSIPTNPVVDEVIDHSSDMYIRWKADVWSSCSVPCGRGTQKRDVFCEKKSSDGKYITVTSQLCDQVQIPLTTRECYSGPCGEWIVGEWEQCSVGCGPGVQRREVECKTASDILLPNSLCATSVPNKTRPCNMGPCEYRWIYTLWSKQCRSYCGNATRTVRCATTTGTVVEDMFCASEMKPATAKKCSKNKRCNNKWYSGSWSKCSVTCGSGVKTRDVLCMSQRDHSILLDAQCDYITRPTSQKQCAQKSCGSTWYMTEWSQCSATCDRGSKIRLVQCISVNKEQSQGCNNKRRPRKSKSCSNRPCDSTHAFTTDSSCVDSYGHCALVVRARLCQYKYYRQMCCDTCLKTPRA